MDILPISSTMGLWNPKTIANHRNLKSLSNSCAHAPFFAELLNLYLEQGKVRPVDLARQLSVEAATVHNWRTNKRLPDLAMVYQMGATLGLSGKTTARLIGAWRVTRSARDFIPYLEEAMRMNDLKAVRSIQTNFASEIDAIRDLIRIQTEKLQRPKSSGVAPSDPQLDPDVWLYSY